MTELERLRGLDQPEWMLQELVSKGSRRKLVLLGAAFCRQIHNLFIDKRTLAAIEMIERWADCEKVDDLRRARVLANRSVRWIESCTSRIRNFDPRENSTELNAAMAVWQMALLDRYQPLSNVITFLYGTAQDDRSRMGLRATLGELLCDVFRTHFLPITFDPRWLTSTVLDLARSFFEGGPRQAGGDLAGLPILADALMDAGCDDEELLAHCRGEGPHVRGCWVLDLILGKN
jgi:hypothetical protein